MRVVFEAIRMNSHYINKLRKGPERDREIDIIVGNIRKAAQIGMKMPIVQYLGQRGKIHQIHMRNIRGSLNNFYEVFPDEGELAFSKVMRILRDTQFSRSICPDHIPYHPDDPGGFQAFAFGYG
jgi:hypothetical protein